ncbi:hypothetical protein LX36DRAFT_290802 [Colletotrichum falcatum]|nr:hypothetical protein LX36DRAFT_290802 [Colletotrichum falcatum]
MTVRDVVVADKPRASETAVDEDGDTLAVVKSPDPDDVSTVELSVDEVAWHGAADVVVAPSPKRQEHYRLVNTHTHTHTHTRSSMNVISPQDWASNHLQQTRQAPGQTSSARRRGAGPRTSRRRRRRPATTSSRPSRCGAPSPGEDCRRDTPPPQPSPRRRPRGRGEETRGASWRGESLAEEKRGGEYRINT